MVGRLANHIGVTDIQCVDVLHKSVGVEFRHFKDRLMPLLRRFEHFVVTVVAVARQMPHIGDVHDMRNIVAEVRKRLVENIQKNIGAQVPDMRVIVNRRPAAVKSDMIFVNRNKVLHRASHRVKKS